MKIFLPCPFCGSSPRHLEHKTGFYTERVICDSCRFHLSPEKWQARADVDPQSGNWIAADDYHTNVKALDVALNGEGGASQPSLIDILSQVEQVARSVGMPVLTVLENSSKQAMRRVQQ